MTDDELMAAIREALHDSEQQALARIWAIFYEHITAENERKAP